MSGLVHQYFGFTQGQHVNYVNGYVLTVTSCVENRGDGCRGLAP